MSSTNPKRRRTARGSKDVGGTGNTKSSAKDFYEMKSTEDSSGSTGSKKRPNPALHWMFVYNNYTEESLAELLVKLQREKRFVFETERGDQKGTPHLQGYVEFNQKQRAIEYIGMEKIHWLASSHPADAITYCQKDTAKPGVRVWRKAVKRPLEDGMAGLEFKDWQRQILRDIEHPAEIRTIHWYWEDIGRTGKSTFAIHLVDKYDAVKVSGKTNDIACCIALRDKRGHPTDLIVIDIPRSQGNRVNYTAIEDLKSGCVFSGKYESEPIRFNKPHVIIFANCEPDYSKMSEDRWHVVNITE